MNAETFAEWLRRQGYRVVRTPSSYWYEASPRVYQAFPYHWLIEPREEELSELLLSSRAVALRYSTPVTACSGKVSYHVVCKTPYTIEILPRRARQNVRRGLKYVQIEPISFSRVATEGWALRVDSLSRQGRENAESQAWWRRLCLSAEDLPGFEAWGALHDGQMLASFLAFSCDDCYTFPYQQSDSAALSHRVNNAIFYSVTHEVLDRSDVSKVFFCLQSLDAPCSVDEFKFRMGFTAEPVRQRVVFHPWLAPLFNEISYTLLKRISSWQPNDPRLPKIQGMMHFYLEGKRPPTKQEWPDCLTSCRHELLENLIGEPSL